MRALPLPVPRRVDDAGELARVNTPQRFALLALLAAAAFLSWLLLTVLDQRAAQSQQQPVKLIPPISLVRGPQPPAGRSFPRLALAPPLSPTGPADHSTTAGGTQTSPAATADPSRPVTTPHPSALDPRSVATRSRAVNVEGEAAATAGPSVWDRLAWCESRGQWAINTGNGYYGGLQENLAFWRTYGNRRWARPDLAPKSAQIAAAVMARDSGRGYEPWPQCGRRLGLR